MATSVILVVRQSVYSILQVISSVLTVHNIMVHVFYMFIVINSLCPNSVVYDADILSNTHTHTHTHTQQYIHKPVNLKTTKAMVATLLILNVILALSATAMGGDIICPGRQAPPSNSSSVINKPLLDTFAGDFLRLTDNDGDLSMRVRMSKLFFIIV